MPRFRFNLRGLDDEYFALRRWETADGKETTSEAGADEEGGGGIPVRNASIFGTHKIFWSSFFGTGNSHAKKNRFKQSVLHRCYSVGTFSFYRLSEWHSHA